MITVFDRVKTAVGKGENAGCLHVFLFPQHFLRPFSLGSLKVGLHGKELNHFQCKNLTFIILSHRHVR